MLPLSPYFEALARQPHMCPKCGHRLELRPLSMTWDRAMWHCDACKWARVEIAPKAAEMGQRDPVARPAAPARPAARRRGRIIEVDFGGAR